MGLLACWWIWVCMTSGTPWYDEVISITTAVILNATLKLWVALEAGLRLAEDKKMASLNYCCRRP